MMFLKRKTWDLLATFVVAAVLLGSLYSLTFAQQSAGLFSATRTSNATAVDRTVLRSRVVEVDFAQLGGTQRENGRVPSGQTQLTLNLFEDTELTAVLHKQEPLTDGSGYSWVGRLADIPQSQVIFVVRDGLTSADIRSADGAYHIRPLGDGAHQIQQLNPNAYIENHNDGVAIPNTSGTNEMADRIAKLTSFNDNRQIQAIASDDGTYIDVLVGYTSESKAYYGGVDETETMIHLLIAQANETFANSLVTTTLRLVHAVEVIDYTEVITGIGNLYNLQDGTDGELDELHTLRDEYDADIVHLLLSDVEDSCGYAYVLEHPTGANESTYGFSLSIVTCAYGNLSFAHEIGHNLGARHDWYVDASTGTAPDEASYNHGRIYQEDLWRTVMAYNSHCYAILSTTACTRLPYFSNPDIDYDGVPTGIVSGTNVTCTTGNVSNPDCDADNAQTLRQNASIVAGFRTSQLTPSLFKDSSAEFGFAGYPITFTIYVTNNTETTLENIVITDSVPENTVLGESSLSSDAQTADSLITWTTNQSLAANETLSRSFVLTPVVTSDITNTAYISASNADAWAESNPATVYIRPTIACSFEDGFEDGTLDSPWLAYAPEGYGRIQITNTITNKNDVAISPVSGDYQLVLDDSNSDYVYYWLSSLSSVILAIGPDVLPEAELSFWWADNADEDGSYDGVFLSDDGGNSWQTVMNFVSDADYLYQQEVIDLGTEATNLGIDTTVPVLLKFQGYDNSDFYNRDGYTFDDFSIELSDDRCDIYLPHISQE